LAWIRSLIFGTGYFVFTIVYGSLSLPLFFFPARARHKITVSWTHLIIFWARICCGVKFRVIGMENIEKRRWPVVVLSKHQSTWETLFLQGLFWPASTILKKELLSIPFFGWGLRALRPIAIDRKDTRTALREVKAQGKRRLEEGLNLIIFPEGTRIACGAKGKYARSGADIAVENNVSIIPIAHNAGSLWPSKRFIKQAGTITVVVGSEISPQGRDSRGLMSEVENWIEQTCDQIAKQAV